jgi:hypothetical protein
MADFEGPNQWQVREFVHKVVRLPPSGLAEVHDRVMDGDLSRHAAVVRDLITASPAARKSAEALRTLILQEAWTAPRHPGAGPVNPDWIAESVLASAQALMEREVLENSVEPRRRDAYAALTAPFQGIIDG